MKMVEYLPVVKEISMGTCSLPTWDWGCSKSLQMELFSRYKFSMISMYYADKKHYLKYIQEDVVINIHRKSDGYTMELISIPTIKLLQGITIHYLLEIRVHTESWGNLIAILISPFRVSAYIILQQINYIRHFLRHVITTSEKKCFSLTVQVVTW